MCVALPCDIPNRGDEQDGGQRNTYQAQCGKTARSINDPCAKAAAPGGYRYQRLVCALDAASLYRPQRTGKHGGPCNEAEIPPQPQ